MCLYRGSQSHHQIELSFSKKPFYLEILMTIKTIELNKEKILRSHHYTLYYVFMCSRRLKFAKLF